MTTGRGTRGAGARPPGFTLIELLVVMVIIGIIIALVLTAAMGGIRQAEQRATEGLVVKLETGMTDRIEALLGQRADANQAHAYLAALWNSGLPPNPRFLGLNALEQNQRAQTIAQFDRMKADVPDVFVIQLGNPDYPINFGAGGYGGSTMNIAGSMAAHAAYFLPIGSGIDNNPAGSSFGANLVTVPQTTGVYGASYSVAAGIYTQLAQAAFPGVVAAGGTPPNPQNLGHDQIDNNGNGLIDELSENGTDLANAMVNLLRSHTHKTARAEMLYAVLVEGQGPLGSVFSRDEFSDSEVRDTDGDGLLEFIDAWGEPLQFYRWPVSYASDSQRGAGSYGGSFDTREQNPLDPNQQLMNPAWWSGSQFNTSGPWSAGAVTPMSGGASTFHRLFFTLTDPNANPSLSPVSGAVWDRGPTSSNGFGRRAYYSRFLILSGGPDRIPGVPVLDPTYYAKLADYTASGSANGPTVPASYSIADVQIESQAARYRVNGAIVLQGSPNRVGPGWLSINPSDPLNAAIDEAGNDDITSQNVHAAGGATR